MVAVCRLNGMTLQAAFDTVGSLLESRYQQWEVAEAKIPSWGEKIDAEVHKYVDGIKAVVQANLSWR